MSLTKVWSVMEKIAPLQFAEKWDNVGLLIENFREAKKNQQGKYDLLLCNDLTENVVDEAVSLSVSAIITYHPVIFHAIKKITKEDRISRIVSKCISNNIAVYSPHTACDASPVGVNYWIGSGFGETVVNKPLEESPIDPNYGIGRYVELKAPYPTLEEMVEKVKQRFNIPHLQLATEQPLSTPIKTIAICAGAGDSVLAGQKADLYITGEMHHHVILDAVAENISVITCNHSNTERGYLKSLKEILEKELGEEYNFVISKVDKDPLSVY